MFDIQKKILLSVHYMPYGLLGVLHQGIKQKWMQIPGHMELKLRGEETDIIQIKGKSHIRKIGHRLGGGRVVAPTSM